jgi:hypothetical protein
MLYNKSFWAGVFYNIKSAQGATNNNKEGVRKKIIKIDLIMLVHVLLFYHIKLMPLSFS